MPKRNDKTTEKLIERGKKLEELVNSSGWAEARKLFIERIASLRDINAIDIQEADASNILALITAKKLAADALAEFISEIEGSAEQYKTNMPVLERVTGEFIINLEEVNE